MKNLLLILSVLLSTSLFGQIGPDGTGIVRDYYIGPNADLSGANLEGAFLDASGYEINLTGADLSGANLTGAWLRYADLTGANLEGANLSRAQCFHVNLSGANLKDALLAHAQFGSVNLTGADLSGTDLRWIMSYSITGSPTLPSDYQIFNGRIVGPYVNLSLIGGFEDASLEGANFFAANLEGAFFSGADLRNSNFEDADLEGADLSGANLQGANLSDDCNLQDANLSGANLTGANLIGAWLGYADLTGANLEGAFLDGSTVISNATISSSTILPTGYDLDWFRSKEAIVPQQGYTIETYSSTNLVNWSLISSESFQLWGDVSSLKTIYSDTSNTLESHYIDSTISKWSLITSEAVNSNENTLFFKSQLTPQ